MTKQLDLFDLKKGEKLRDAGKELAADNRAAVLALAKDVARGIAASRLDRLCSIDEVQRELLEKGLDLGMAAGSVFKGRHWEFAGYKKTKRITSHARNISIWRLK